MSKNQEHLNQIADPVALFKECYLSSMKDKFLNTLLDKFNIGDYEQFKTLPQHVKVRVFAHRQKRIETATKELWLLCEAGNENVNAQDMQRCIDSGANIHAHNGRGCMLDYTLSKQHHRAATVLYAGGARTENVLFKSLFNPPWGFKEVSDEHMQFIEVVLADLTKSEILHTLSHFDASSIFTTFDISAPFNSVLSIPKSVTLYLEAVIEQKTLAENIGSGPEEKKFKI